MALDTIMLAMSANGEVTTASGSTGKLEIIGYVICSIFAVGVALRIGQVLYHGRKSKKIVSGLMEQFDNKDVDSDAFESVVEQAWKDRHVRFNYREDKDKLRSELYEYELK